MRNMSGNLNYMFGHMDEIRMSKNTNAKVQFFPEAKVMLHYLVELKLIKCRNTHIFHVGTNCAKNYAAIDIIKKTLNA